ncbi:MAG: LON peptidase substrate-binding domain-containing protein [Gammaproteobacteria bacterium]|nr:LON peptidase substrate-binding domain-containing protein [Gammaproteobacteria bacterium]
MNNHSQENCLPVFPLNTVMFVNGILQLQIFEQRYLQMIKTCLKNQHGFITTLIRSGREVGDTPDVYPIGCYVDIIDWNTLDNSLLGITTQARQRVRLTKTYIHNDQLMTADFDYIDNLSPTEHVLIDQELLSLLQALHEHPFVATRYPEIDYSSSIEIAYKLCELLPISNTDKQKLLEAEHSHLLLDQLKTIIANLENL